MFSDVEKKFLKKSATYLSGRCTVPLSEILLFACAA